MIPSAFGYTRAASIDEALSRLAGDDGANKKRPTTKSKTNSGNSEETTEQ